MPLTATNSAGYPSPAGIMADPVVFAPLEGRLCVLLVLRREQPYRGVWALPGGFMSPNEEPDGTARRKLTEKTGLRSIYLEQLATYASPHRDPRGWLPSVTYLALVDAAALREDERDARWHPVDALPPLAFDHEQMIRDGMARLRGKVWYSSIAAPLLPPRFTLAELRRLYEAITGVRYEVSNFRRTVEGSGMIVSTEEIRQGAAGRPARLFAFADRTPTWSARRSRMPAALSTDWPD
jgi:8-oxo-dGTP diphosphatase